jgi:cell volume regulation protein A
MMRRVALPSSGLYPLAVLSFTVLAYAGTSAALHASGFAAVYTAALVLGNSELPHRAATRSFSEGVAWIAQIGLFVMLGLLVTPGDILPKHVLIATLAGLLLTFVARPLSVLACVFAHRLSVRQQLFVSWAGLRGAVPIVLATIPLAENVDDSEELFNIVFVMVVIYTLLTGPTLPWVAARLEVTERGEARDLDVEAAPLERVAADLLQVSITSHSRLHGVEVAELRLPVGASVSLVVRAGRTLVPDAGTVLRRGDELLVVTPRKLREATEDRLRAVSRRGRLAHWLDAPEAPH